MVMLLNQNDLSDDEELREKGMGKYCSDLFDGEMVL
jgi:hypothetical protein